MPQALVATAPRSPSLRTYEQSDPAATELLIESELSAFKHGTGLRGYRADTRDYTAAFDWEAGVHREGDTTEPDYPIALGNMTVGTVRDVGADVEAFDPGDRVYGHLPIRETHTVAADTVSPAPAGMAAESIVYADPARVGLHAVRIGEIGVADTVLVVGAGAIGQMAAQVASLGGASAVWVSDPIERRREAALEHGADRVLDPIDVDVGELVKDELTAGDRPGVDVSVETSGSYAGLNDALRATAFGGTIASCGYYAGDQTNVAFAGEWHRNRLDLRSVRPPSEPHREAPRWSFDRLRTAAFELLRAGDLTAEGLLDPIVPIEDAPDGMRLIDERPEKSIKLGVSY